MEKIEAYIKYHDPALLPVEAAHDGEWFDLRCAEDVTMNKGEYRLLSLGVTIKIPDGWEIIIAPRSSTYKQWGILLANGIGVIDQKYGQDEADILRFPAIAMRDTKINKNDRICQFRFQRVQPKVQLLEVNHINGIARGGVGSTGRA